MTVVSFILNEIKINPEIKYGFHYNHL